MRKKRTVQMSIFDLYSEHEIGKELKAISDYLDDHPEFLDWVEVDLHVKEVFDVCLLYTSPSPRDRTRSRMPSSA